MSLKENDENQNPNSSIKLQRISEILLVCVNVLWGTSFILTKITIETVPLMFYMGIRFFFGAVAFLPFFKYFKFFDKKLLKISFIAGFLYFISNILQTIGLQYTSASKAAFITALGLIFVPIILALYYKKKIESNIWIALILASVGTYILSFAGIEVFTIGDPLILICAVIYAIYIIYLDLHVKEVNFLLFSMFQLIFMSGFSFLSSLIFEDFYYIFGVGSSVIFTMQNWLVLIYMGVVVSCVTFIFQSYGQRHIAPSRAAIIFTLEPVFATIFALIIGGEQLVIQTVFGAILIFAGILLSIERKKKKKTNRLN
ncbi:MAG: DMT family transporter [Promethearchaeota archaeon]